MTEATEIKVSCCGSETTTPYCPMCGKKQNLPVDPRAELVDYLRDRKAACYARLSAAYEKYPEKGHCTLELKLAALSRLLETAIDLCGEEEARGA